MVALNLIWTLLVDLAFSWARMLVALLASILLGLAIGIYAARSESAERIIMPIVDVLQTLPILAFFPFVILLVVTPLPGPVGVNLAVVLLIITSMLWNIIFGAYEAIKTMPNEIIEVSRISQLGRLDRISKVLIPASMPKVVEQSVLSWAIGLFYLVTSEIFSTGNSVYSVKHGIGVALTSLALSGSYYEYAVGILLFIVFVAITRFLLFARLERRFEVYRNEPTTRGRLDEVMRKLRIRRLFTAFEYPRPGGRHRALHKGAEPKFMPGIRARTATLIRTTERPRAAAIGAVVALAAIAVGAIYLSGAVTAQLVGYEYIALVSLAVSFARVWLAFAAIVVVAVPVGVYLIFVSRHRNAYTALFQVLASIPATILLPIIVAVLAGYQHSGELVAMSIFFISGIWYVIFGIMAHRSYIQQSVLEVKRLFQVKGISAWRSIYIRAIVPGLITGGITAIAAEWNASIVAEQFTSTGVGAGSVITSVSTGMGKFLDVQLAAGHVWIMGLALINMTIMIIAINRLLWKRAYTRVEGVYS